MKEETRDEDNSWLQGTSVQHFKLPPLVKEKKKMVNSGVYPVFAALCSCSSLILLKGSFCLNYKVDLGLYDDSGWKAEGDCLKKLVSCAESSVKWNISCHIGGQEMWQTSAISGLSMWMRAPQREHNACDPADTATPHHDCWGAGERMQESAPHLPPLMVAGNRIWPQIAEVHMKGMNSVSQRLASSHI